MKRLCIILTVLLVLTALPAGAAESYLWPVEGYYNISSGFGKRTSGTHRGIDITGESAGLISGAAVQAAKNGTISAVSSTCTHNYPKSSSCGCGGGYGNFVYMLHDDGTQTRYAHLATVWVGRGQTVHRGQTLGTVGSTGSSAGYHLHFEIRSTDGETVYNPMPQNGDGRHTYLGSSTAITNSIAYAYGGSPTLKAKMEGGEIRENVQKSSEGCRIIVAQYSGGRLVRIDAGAEGGTEVRFAALVEADSARVMLWEGVSPMDRAVFLQW